MVDLEQKNGLYVRYAFENFRFYVEMNQFEAHLMVLSGVVDSKVEWSFSLSICFLTGRQNGFM